MTEYKPITYQQQPKFAGIKTFLRLPYLKTIQGLDFAVAGVPWDGATSYRTGQRQGPDAIRKVSVTLRPFNLALDVGIFEHCCGVDYGDLPVVAGYIEDTYAKIEAGLAPLVAAGVIPVLMGGDHSITLPELRAVSQTHGPVALIHFDSHTDTNDQYFGKPYYHGSPFRRAVEENVILPQSLSSVISSETGSLLQLIKRKKTNIKRITKFFCLFIFDHTILIFIQLNIKYTIVS